MPLYSLKASQVHAALAAGTLVLACGTAGTGSAGMSGDPSGTGGASPPAAGSGAASSSSGAAVAGGTPDAKAGAPGASTTGGVNAGGSSSDMGGAGTSAGGGSSAGGAGDLGLAKGICSAQCEAGCQLIKGQPERCDGDCNSMFGQVIQVAQCRTALHAYIGCLGGGGPIYYCPGYSASSACATEARAMIDCFNAK